MIKMLAAFLCFLLIAVTSHATTVNFTETFDAGNLDNWDVSFNEYNTGWTYQISGSNIIVNDVTATQSVNSHSKVFLRHYFDTNITGEFNLHWDLAFAEPASNSFAIGMYIWIPGVAQVLFNDTSSYYAAEMITYVYNPSTGTSEGIIYGGSYGSMGYSGDHTIDITRDENGLVELFLNGSTTPFRTQADNFNEFNRIELVFYRGLWSGGESFPYGQVSTDTITFSGVAPNAVPEPVSIGLLMTGLLGLAVRRRNRK